MINDYYKEKLSSLHVDRSSGHPKPHKVCLLLAIMDLIENDGIRENNFIINDELKDAFHVHFEKLKKLNDSENIIQPFYHLKSDGIWHFRIKSGMQDKYNILKSKPGTPSIRALFEVIEYAYLDDQLFDYFKSEQSRVIIKECLLENLEDLSVQFHRWLLSLGKSEKTAVNYVGAVRGTISNWASEANITHQNLITIQSYSRINRILQQLSSYDEFVQKNTTGNQMYSAALNSYQKFLSFTCQAEVSEDIEDIISDQSLDSTQKSMLVNTRVGQGKFREDLIKYWHGCALTGYQSTEFLVASHIKPWRAANSQERLDKYNGILLLPNLDKAFDLGYISFKDNGTILISEFMESPRVLGIEESMKIHFESPHLDYLEYHRECVFERKTGHINS